MFALSTSIENLFGIETKKPRAIVDADGENKLLLPEYLVKVFYYTEQHTSLQYHEQTQNLLAIMSPARHNVACEFRDFSSESEDSREF
jgi:hypothetical protein